MIPSVTVTLTVPADRLAELGAFCMEAGVDCTPTAETSDDAADSSDPQTEPPKRGRGRPRGSKNKPAEQMAPVAEATKPEPAAEPDPEPVAEPKSEKPSGPTMDDLRVAVRKAVVGSTEGLQRVEAALAAVGVDSVGKVPADKIAQVLAEIM